MKISFDGTLFILSLPTFGSFFFFFFYWTLCSRLTILCIENMPLGFLLGGEVRTCCLWEVSIWKIDFTFLRFFCFLFLLEYLNNWKLFWFFFSADGILVAASHPLSVIFFQSGRGRNLQSTVFSWTFNLHLWPPLSVSRLFLFYFSISLLNSSL